MKKILMFASVLVFAGMSPGGRPCLTCGADLDTIPVTDTGLAKYIGKKVAASIADSFKAAVVVKIDSVKESADSVITKGAEVDRLYKKKAWAKRIQSSTPAEGLTYGYGTTTE